MTYLPNIFISLRYEQISTVGKMLFALINNLAMSMGIQLIGIFEGLGTGLNFTNFTQGISFEDKFSMAHVLAILFFNNFTHMFLVYYFDNLFPGDHGIDKPWDFIFKRFFTNRKLQFSTDNQVEMGSKMNNEDETNYSTRNIGIKIANLFKVFKTEESIKTAVKNLSLNIYEGQITVLLGHNGAGKR